MTRAAALDEARAAVEKCAQSRVTPRSRKTYTSGFIFTKDIFAAIDALRESGNPAET